ncbi:MarR family winged helix-turn-helix transcriptional regulator [Allobranchiibius huperziae]|uniref:DNA-binding MarR family transcriptional regulator n=1 Tax=Allobranchiibius huperziae TaxID=1874116 RepID=A0A853DHP0_9MICO|nr:MarR family transcriptional regulator [Allobranchiibius huperziae]NYJ74341.1 DNA-binding MarR family transcriptional regulator [Allobranchiibius huperziae]
MKTESKSRDEPLRVVLVELRFFARRLRREWSTNVPEITFAEATLMSAVTARPHPTAVDVAADLQIDKSTASRQIAVLEQRGLIEREAAPGERRAQWLRLTPEGRHILQQSDTVRIEAIRDRVSDWTDAEVTQFADLLRRFNARSS